MNRIGSVLLAACLLAGSAAGEDVLFHKSRILDRRGREHKVDLVFMEGSKALAVRESAGVVTTIPYDAISKVTYSHTSRHRVKEGGQGLGSIQPCIDVLGCALIGPLDAAVLLASGGTMLTKEKRRWLDIDYQDPSGKAEATAVRLDKSEYDKILATMKALTGKDVEVIPEERKQKDKKNEGEKK
jgi:hypothetical protein